MATDNPTFNELEETAIAVINSLKMYPEFASARIAIIGGAALWKYFPAGRTTSDLDFIITVSGAPQSVKNHLLQLPNFAEYAQLFVFKHPGGKDIQIDFTPDWQSAYLPAAVTTISAADTAALPYISPIDLLVLKVNTCGMRATNAKKAQDAADALNLAQTLSANGWIVLSDQQKEAARVGVQDLALWSGRDANWWTWILQL